MAPGVRLPREAEGQYLLIVGDKGSGKSTIARALASQAIARGDRVLLHCVKGDVAQSFRPGEAVLIGAHHAHGWAWDAAADLRGEAAYMDLAAAVIPISGSSAFWAQSARAVFVDVLSELASEPGRTNWSFPDLAERLLDDPAAIKARVERLDYSLAHRPSGENGLRTGDQTSTQTGLRQRHGPLPITREASRNYPGDVSGHGDLPAEFVSVSERIELPAVTPVVTQHRRLAVHCPSCGARVVAPVPEEARGTPFGPRLHAVATYLKTFQALSYERLQALMSDLFGLTLSQGGLMNLLRRAQGCSRSGREAAVARLRRAEVVASDETGVRIEGSNAYHWVFRSAGAVVHHASPTRGAVVVRETMDGHRPAVWISDRYTAQQGHAAEHQTCLAHLARDVAYVVETSDDPVPWRLQLWLQSVFALAKRVTDLAASTLSAKRRTLDRQLGAIIAEPSRCDLTRDLQAKIGRARDQLLVFFGHPGLVEPTNNGCERLLRPAVVQRKMTVSGVFRPWSAPDPSAGIPQRRRGYRAGDHGCRPASRRRSLAQGPF